MASFAKLICRSKLQRKKYSTALKGLGVLVSAAGVFQACQKQEISANVGAAVRFLRCLRTGLTISLDYTFSQLGLREGVEGSNYDYMMGRIHLRSAQRLRDACLENGGLYVKMGQGLVSLNHILPREYTETLKSLQDKCLARRPGEVDELFLQDFGQRPEEVFDSFDPIPIAAASLAQVFKAKLKTGEAVAVKVQYIDLQQRFSSDVATIDFLLKLIGFMHPSFNFGWVLDDLRDTLHQELDFVGEGKNAERCAQDLAALKYVYVPKVYWEMTNLRVLTTELIDAHKISDVEAMKCDGLDLADVDRKLFSAFGEQIFRTGFVHADPHPGNVFIRKFNGKTQIILLDHGLYQYLNADVRYSLSAVWKSIVLHDLEDVAKYARKLGVEDYEIFSEILTQRPLKFGYAFKTKLTQEDLDYMREMARDRFDKIMTVIRTMPRSLLLVLRNLNTIRSIAKEHGDPINRYTALARIAAKESFRTETNGRFINRVRKFKQLVLFEVKLRWKAWKMNAMKTMLRLLELTGRSPGNAEIRNLMV